MTVARRLGLREMPPAAEAAREPPRDLPASHALSILRRDRGEPGRT
jgi:hypothetical protein